MEDFWDGDPEDWLEWEFELELKIQSEGDSI